MRSRNTITILLAGILMCLAAGCIKNDIPYARIQANILTLEARGQEGLTAIDTVAMTATITFPEEVDIYNVTFNAYTLTPGASVVDNMLDSVADLSHPLYVYVQLYQNWLWKIIGVQTIERYLEVEGQMGETIIDVPAHRVVVYVRASANLASIPIKAIKLGAKGSTMTPSLTEGSTYDGRTPYTLTIENWGRSEEWTIYTETINEPVKTVAADGWTGVAWVYGQAEEGLDNGVEYRIKGTEIWTRVPQSDVTQNGGSFTACINHLSPLTTYETRAYSGEFYGEILEFTTGTAPQLPNSNFSDWWLDKKVWCPWAEGGTPFWGTGNKGAATLGSSNTFPTEDTPTGTGYAACLETRFVGVGSIGKIAAGNIFAGDYVRTDGTNGILAFGRPFTDRPTRLTGQFKYKSEIIQPQYARDLPQMAGKPDTAVVWVALVDLPEQLEIRTKSSDRQLFEPTADYVIGYGIMKVWQTVDTYTPFEIHIDYVSTSRVPTYILVTASASFYGDYFVGAPGSTLYIDDFHLEYDY